MATSLITVIATAGRAELLGRTLASLAECRLPDIYRETIVVENGPKCGAEEVVRQSDSVLRARYVYQAEPNKSRALNAVLDEVGDCLVFMTDDDIRFAPATLQAYARAAEGIDSGCVFGGPLEVDYESEPPEWLKPHLPPSAVGWPSEEEPEGNDRLIFRGGNWAAFAQNLRNAGGFNPEKGPLAPVGGTGEETEMQRLLHKQGVPSVYVPEARVWHYVPLQRCSARWAMKRIYQNAVAYGFDNPDHATRLLGFPRWMLPQWLKKGVRYAVTRVNRNERARFEAGREFWSFTGVMMGARAAREQIRGKNT